MYISLEEEKKAILQGLFFRVKTSCTERWPSGLRRTLGKRVYASTVSSNLTFSANKLT